MKIGMIALSGVRAESEELNRFGREMPAIRERANAIAAMPSLSLLTLAALTPAEVDVEYHEVPDVDAPGALPAGLDLVAIATQSAQVFQAYRVADRYRVMGVPVVMGGIHVSTLPEEALRHCASVVVGEAEAVWGRVVEDARCGRLARVYRGTGEFDLRASPMPRFELADPEKYNRFPVQTCRGCPHRCDFCASSILLTRGYKLKPIGQVIEEVREIKRVSGRSFVEFADDNSFCSRAHAKAMLRALADEDVHWFTECDISVAQDEELLELMREAGCREVLIGLESPTEEGLDGVELRRNWKLKQACRYEEAVRRIQSKGIGVNGCFVLGLDGQTPAVFDAVYDFTDRTSLFDVQITVMTAFPGTLLHERLSREGRIIEDRAWHKCTLFDVNVRPTGMTVEELRKGFMDLARRVYDPAFVADRRRRFFATQN